MSTEKKKSWRDVLPVHPAAELFPLMSKDELQALADDIKKNGLRERVAVYRENGKDRVLDGRNRLDAKEANGDLEIHVRVPGQAEPVLNPCVFIERSPLQGLGGYLYDASDPYAYVISANIHRRHLTAEQKRELTAKLLKARPEKSNRQTAKETGVSDKTVAGVRADLEANAEIPHKAERVEATGRKARGVKPGTAKKSEQSVYGSTPPLKSKANGHAPAHDDEPTPKPTPKPETAKPDDLDELFARVLAEVRETLAKEALRLGPDGRLKFPETLERITPVGILKRTITHLRADLRAARETIAALKKRPPPTEPTAVELDKQLAAARMQINKLRRDVALARANGRKTVPMSKELMKEVRIALHPERADNPKEQDRLERLVKEFNSFTPMTGMQETEEGNHYEPKHETKH